jgi:hypothetical protein
VSGARSGGTVRPAAAFEERLREFDYESTEELRALWVGEKEASEHAALVARYADLFSREQLDALRAEEEAAETPDGRERLHRLRKTCENLLLGSLLAEEQDALATAELAAEVEFHGETMPLRNALAQVGLLEGYDDREELAELAGEVNASFNDRRLELMRVSEDRFVELTGKADPVVRSEEDKGISLRELARTVSAAADLTRGRYDELGSHWLDVLLGSRRAEHPPVSHVSYMLRLAPLQHVFTRERATEVCVATLAELGFDLQGSGIRTDLEDRPQKSPRPVCFASDPPAVVHLVTRPQGGLPDYQSFLHEAGHAFHFAGTDPALPFAFRAITRDQGLMELYAFLVESIIREAGWHARHFEVTPAEAAEHAQATRFLDSYMFRRYAAKLEFELEFWSRFPSDGGTPDGYAERLSEATGFVYFPNRFLTDMDPGFYSADYLRAWIRAAQLRSVLRERVGDGWWRSTETGELLRDLFREGLRPASEDVAERFGFDPLDTAPLAAELNA